MNFCLARVAPEKAVFRPALPLHVLPGITEMHMTNKEILNRPEDVDFAADKIFLDSAISSFPPEMITSLASLVVGFGSHDGYVNVNLWLEAHPTTALAGRLAWDMLNYDEKDCLEIVNGFKQLGPDRFIEAIREAMRKENEVR